MAAVDITASDRTAFIVRVFDYGQRKTRRVAVAGGLETLKAFHRVPAVVASLFNQVDFLAIALPDIASPKFASQPIEAKTPGIA